MGGVGTPLADRVDMAYVNSSVTRASATVLVTATGMDTEVGHISGLLQGQEQTKTPLTRQLDTLTTQILTIAGVALLGLIQDLTLLAMVGIVDPPRPQAKTAIATARAAGIRVRMITGDHAVTAEAIARDLGIDGRAITGGDFSAMTDEEAPHSRPAIRRQRETRKARLSPNR